MKQDMIVILDLGSHENTVVARAIRALGVYSEIYPHDITAAELKALPNVKGIIINGGLNNVIDGVEMSVAAQKVKDKFRIEKIGYIFQDFKLINDMTVADNIGILRLEGVDISGMDDMLRSLDIYEKKNAKIKHLSGGQKQRVAIARALVKHPDIILADEPTGNLNFAIGEQVIKELIEVSRGKTLIAVTHDDRLAKYFDEVIDMNEMTGGMRDTVIRKEAN